MEPLIQPFVDYLKFEKRYSAHTIRAYQDDLLQFFAFAQTQFSVTTLREISPSVIRSWLASLREEGITARSVTRKTSSLQSYFKHGRRAGLIDTSPMAGISAPKISKRLPVYVEQQDIQVLFSHVEFPDNWEGLTDRLILAIFYHTGMRLSELMNLKERQVDRSKNSIKVLGKGNKERIIPVSGVLMTLIDEYCQAKRRDLEKPDTDLLLVLKNGKKLYPKYLYRSVQKYLSQITTVDKKSPHVLRHTFATHLSNNGADINAIKELLGHASLSSTQVYTHNTIEKLKDVYRKAHPKAGSE